MALTERTAVYCSWELSLYIKMAHLYDSLIYPNVTLYYTAIILTLFSSLESKFNENIFDFFSIVVSITRNSTWHIVGVQ